MGLPKYGEIEYDYRGYPRCHICGKAFKKVLSHVTQKHGITAYEYKKQFGLDVTKGIMCEESRALARKRAYENYDVAIKKNLLQNGKKSRFKKESKGRTRDQVSAQTLARLRGNFLKGRDGCEDEE